MAARARAGKRQLLFIEGELGQGKSRLAAEMVREWIMEGGVGYGSKSMSYGQQIPYQAWREILVAIFGLTPSHSTEHKLAQLKIGVADLPTPPEQGDYWSERLPLLADVLGIEAPENDFMRHIPTDLHRQNTFALIEAILRHQSTRHPLLILLEDVQWADDLSLSLMAYLTQKLADMPTMLALICRPGADLSPLVEVRDLPDAYTMVLEPLPRQESLDLIRILMGAETLTPEVEEVVLDRAEGNPFFLQELTGAILDVISNHQKQTANLLETLDLPETVHDVIMARIDRLSEDEKLTLKIASVIGTHFQRLLLSEVHPITDAQYHLPAQLDRLEHENLLRLEQPAPKWEYVFRNVIAQEVVYEGLLLTQRRQLHGVVGEALENIAPEEVEQLAFHFKRSHNWDKALYYLKIASQRARREYANHAAIGYLSEILTCLVNRSTDEKRSTIINTEYWDTLLERAKLYHLIGWRDEELEDLGTLGIMAEALNDHGRRALAAKQWTYLYETSGDYDSGLELVERCVQLAQEAGHEKLVGEGYNLWGKLLYLRGDYETANDYLQQALDIAEVLEDDAARADCLHNQGLVAFYRADYVAAFETFQQTIELRRRLGDQVGLGNSLTNLGQVYYELGQYQTAKATFDQSLALHRTLGNRTGEADARHGLGKIERSLGNYEVSLQLLEEALTFYQTIGDQHQEAYCLYDLGFLHARREDYEKALVFLEEAIALLKELKAPWWAIVRALNYYGWTLIQSGAPREARNHLIEALRIASETRQEIAMMESTTLLGEAALAIGDLSMADTCAQRTAGFLERRGVQGVEHPAMMYLTAYHIFQALEKGPQTRKILAQGREFITSQAAQIDDPTARERYLNNIPENREIQALAG